MLITYLRLEHYKRFPLSTVEIFEKEFTHKLTMIVGPNGCGKSSLISELSPLPAQKDNFYKGGYKEIHITHQDKQYRLISDFRTHATFSFFQNDVDLNTAGNVTMQKELAYQHFGITEIIHKLLTGEESFTEMGLPARKKLFHAITHLNIDSILANYETLKEELKNNEFLQKNLTSQLVNEKHKLSDPELGQKLTDRVSVYRQHIDTLLSIRQEIYRYSHGKTIEESADALKQLELTKSSLWETNYIGLTANNPKDLPRRISGLQTDMKTMQTVLQSLYAKLERLFREKKTLDSTNNRNIEQLKLEGAELQRRIQASKQSLQILKDDSVDVNKTQASLQLLESSLPEILESLPPNPNGKYSKQNYTELLEKKNNYLQEQTKLLREHSSLSTELKEALTHKELNCPNCHHTWLPEDVDLAIKTLTEKIKSIEIKQAEHEQLIKATDSLLNEQSTYLTQLSLLTTIYTSTKDALAPLWKVVTEKSLLREAPSQILQVVRTCLRECQTLTSIEELKKKNTETEELYQRVQELSYDSKATLEKEILSTEDEIYIIRMSQEEVSEAFKALLHIENVHSALRNLESASNLAKSDLQEANLKHLSLAIMKEIDSELSMSKISLIETEQEISKYKLAETSVKKLEAQLEEVNEHVKVLTILTDELSPKNGFIAKTISNFLNVVIGSINSIIAAVWDYKMILKPINVEENALNYRFKVEVEDRHEIEDVSKISSGMKEITNLAMKITLYKLLGLDHFPVFLDETAANLDSLHTEKIVNWVHAIAASDRYSQIFLITHKESFFFLDSTETIEL